MKKLIARSGLVAISLLFPAEQVWLHGWKYGLIACGIVIGIVALIAAFAWCGTNAFDD